MKLTNEVKISVIVVTYNPDKEKLIRTLYSIVRQKNICFEIVISDDGTKDFDEVLVRKYFSSVNFTNYKIVTHERNQGTVLNYKDGVDNCKGEYVYGISPGDFLYNEDTLHSIYEFVNKYKIDICFGKANYYRYEDNRIKQEKTVYPKWPEIFNLKQNKSFSDIAFFSGQQPIGASYLRRKTVAQKYLAYIAGNVKYVEDYPSTALYLLDNNKIYYYGKPCVWYEVGTGISTNSSDIWRKRMDVDEAEVKEIMFSLHPENTILKVKYNKNLSNRLKHLVICLIAIYIKIVAAIKFHQTSIDYEHKSELEKILNYEAFGKCM